MIYDLEPKVKCCFCGIPLSKAEMNNPDPACTRPGKYCCNHCDSQIVLPARIAINNIIVNALSHLHHTSKD